MKRIPIGAKHGGNEQGGAGMKKRELSLQEKIEKADRMAKMISQVSEDDRDILIAITNAYADGLVAGRMLEREKKIDQICKSAI